jgi:hypothetical protein
MRSRKKGGRWVRRGLWTWRGFGYGGYGLIVIPNASPADPFPIVESFYVMTAHEFPSIFCAGNTDVAYCGFGGFGGGYYLVSGDYFTTCPLYPQTGQICARAFDGSDPQSGLECAGHYSETVTTDETIKIKTPPS